jgi:hypothetical protein
LIRNQETLGGVMGVRGSLGGEGGGVWAGREGMGSSCDWVVGGGRGEGGVEE